MSQKTKAEMVETIDTLEHLLVDATDRYKHAENELQESRATIQNAIFAGYHIKQSIQAFVAMKYPNLDLEYVYDPDGVAPLQTEETRFLQYLYNLCPKERK